VFRGPVRDPRGPCVRGEGRLVPEGGEVSAWAGVVRLRYRVGHSFKFRDPGRKCSPWTLKREVCVEK